MHLTVSGQVPAQKNKHVSWYNEKSGFVVNTTHSSVQKWQKDVAKQLLQYANMGFAEPVSIVYKFYVKDNRRRDIDNMICSINDALKKAELIVDDSWQYLTIGAAEAEIDKLNPRAELWIDPIG